MIIRNLPKEISLIELNFQNLNFNMKKTNIAFQLESQSINRKFSSKNKKFLHWKNSFDHFKIQSMTKTYKWTNTVTSKQAKKTKQPTKEGSKTSWLRKHKNTMKWFVGWTSNWKKHLRSHSKLIKAGRIERRRWRSISYSWRRLRSSCIRRSRRWFRGRWR